MTNEAIGAQIKAIRKKLGMTQQAFAEHFNANTDPDDSPVDVYVTRADVAKYEKGINGVSAVKYVLFLDLDPDFNSASQPMAL